MFLEFLFGSLLGYVWEEIYAALRRDSAIPPLKGLPLKPVYGVLMVVLLRAFQNPTVRNYPSLTLMLLLCIEHIAGYFTQSERRWCYQDRSISRFTGLDSLCGFEVAIFLTLITLRHGERKNHRTG